MERSTPRRSWVGGLIERSAHLLVFIDVQRPKSSVLPCAIHPLPEGLGDSRAFI